MDTEQVYQKIKEQLPYGWFQPSRDREGFGNDLIRALAYVISQFVDLAQSSINQLFPYWAIGVWLDKHLGAIGLRRLSGESDDDARKRYIQEWQFSRNARSGLVNQFNCLVDILEFPPLNPSSLQRPTWTYLSGFSRFIVLERSLQPVFYGFSTFSQSVNSLILFENSALVYPFWQYTSLLQSEYQLDTKEQRRWIASPLLLIPQPESPKKAEIRLCPNRGFVDVFVESDFSSEEVALVQDEIFPLNHFSAGVSPFLYLRLQDVRREPLPYFNYLTPWRSSYPSYLDIPLFVGEYRSRNLFYLIVNIESFLDWDKLRSSVLLLHQKASQIVNSFPFTFIVFSIDAPVGNWEVFIEGKTYFPQLVDNKTTEIIIPQPIGLLQLKKDGTVFRRFELTLFSENLILRINHD